MSGILNVCPNPWAFYCQHFAACGFSSMKRQLRRFTLYLTVKEVNIKLKCSFQKPKEKSLFVKKLSSTTRRVDLFVKESKCVFFRSVKPACWTLWAIISCSWAAQVTLALTLYTLLNVIEKKRWGVTFL